MDLKYTTYRLECIHPFKISRSSFSHYDRIFVYLEQDGLIGRGEAAPSERYEESVPLIIGALEERISLPHNVSNIEELIPIFTSYSNGIQSLRSALIAALLDWWTKKNHISVAEYFGIDRKCFLPTSYTIGISSEEDLSNKINEAEQYRILKIKLGTDADKDTINTIRSITDKTVRIDANEGWDFDTAAEMCKWLSDKNIELIEQPLRVGDLDKMNELKEISSIPLIADENCKTADDIANLADKFDGINIKLAKCGGLDEAFKMVEIAKSSGLKIMLGCMLESSLGITTIGQLIGLADYIDLDGNLLVKNDPYIGINIINGLPKLPDDRGLGVKLKNNFNNIKYKLL